MPNLTFRRLERPQESSNGLSRSARSHVDFEIDGHSLFIMTNAADSDLVGVLGWAVSGRDDEAIDQFLLKRPTDLPDQRQPVFVCPECGDIACGAITLRLRLEGDAVVWEDLAYENGFDESVTDRSSFEYLAFSFPRDQYERAFEELRQSLKRGAA